MTEENEAHLAAVARDLRAILLELREVVRYMKEAESEIPEKMRRFMMYFHDVHDIKYMYESHGQTVPKHVLSEMERCDDRYRHLLQEGADAGWLDRVRAEMSKHTDNRWDHTKALEKPQVKEDGT